MTYQFYEGCATQAEADREYADSVGSERRDVAWILSDRDIWYRNPFYTGPAVPHPEDAQDHDEDEAEYQAAYRSEERLRYQENGF